MRILLLHSDFIKYKPIKKEIKFAEEAQEDEVFLKEVVVLFTAVERNDSELVAQKAIDEISAVLRKLKVNRVLIYPYAHLSSNLGKPSDALKIVKAMAVYLKQGRIETYRAPFGWNKQFTISVKGHPLAEQFRLIISGKAGKEKKISEAITAAEKLESFWYILQPDGKMITIEEFDFNGSEKLEKFAKYEISKVRASQQMPPHVLLMRRLEIADYELGSDPGNMRWYPKGRLIKSLLEEFVTTEMLAYGAMEVETPVMYDFQHPSLVDYMNRFPARQYLLTSEDKDLFLRFAACFGQFLMVHDTQFSYKHTPLKLYELTRYSFRREKSGEVVGLRRLRAFTMPDCHAFCIDMRQAKEEFLNRFKICINVLEGIGLSRSDYETAIRFTKDFYEENGEFIASLAKIFGKPVLIEMWEARFFYFILKWDFNFVDNQDKAAALSTDQIDVENAKRYEITCVGEKGEKHHPLILHCSPSGAIERCIYALLEKAYFQQESGKPPMLPLWLSPTQIRLIPISEKYLEYVKKTVNEIAPRCIRADIDDRTLTLRRKIREAEMEWVPYVVVIGQKEVESGILSVRDRKVRKIRKMKLEALMKGVESIIKSKPFKPLPLPMLLSKRPQFYG